MNRTREQFIDLWADRLIGMALRGLIDEAEDRVKGPLDAGKKARELPPRIEAMLGRMYDDLKPKEPLPVKAAAPQPERKT